MELNNPQNQISEIEKENVNDLIARNFEERLVSISWAAFKYDRQIFVEVKGYGVGHDDLFNPSYSEVNFLGLRINSDNPKNIIITYKVNRQ